MELVVEQPFQRRRLLSATHVAPNSTAHPVRPWSSYFGEIPKWSAAVKRVGSYDGSPSPLVGEGRGGGMTQKVPNLRTRELGRDMTDAERLVRRAGAMNKSPPRS